MILVWVLFLWFSHFFWTDNDLVCAPPPPSGMFPFFRRYNYAHTFAHNSKTTRSIFVKLWKIVTNNMKVTNLNKHNNEILLFLIIRSHWDYHSLYATMRNFLLATEPSMLGIYYQVTYATHHHSVLSRINYGSCICSWHSLHIQLEWLLNYCPVALK